MQYIITGNNRGQRITKTAANDFIAFTLIGQLNQEGVTDICMNQVKQEESKAVFLPEKDEQKCSNGLARMRTVAQVLEYLKHEDPESCISEHYLRQLVKKNKVPVFYAGRKCLVNLDKLLEYLRGELPEEKETAHSNYGSLRKVIE